MKSENDNQALPNAEVAPEAVASEGSTNGGISSPQLDTPAEIPLDRLLTLKQAKESPQARTSTPAIASAPSPEPRWQVKDFVPIAITALNAIGWIVVYFLVLSPQAEQSKAQTRLLDEQIERLRGMNQKVLDQLDIQEKSGRVQLDNSNRRLTDLQIARIEAAAVRLEDQLANLRSRTQTTTDLNAVRQSLRPNMLFGKFNFTFPKATEANFEHEIKNIGVNAVAVSSPIVRLAVKPIGDSPSPSDLLVEGRDYAVRVYSLGMFQPGVARNVDYTIELLNLNLRGLTLHYALTWNNTTDQFAVSTAAQLLGKQVTASELSTLSSMRLTLVGTLTYAR